MTSFVTYSPDDPDETWEATLSPADSEAGGARELRFTRQEAERDHLVEAVDRANRRYLGLSYWARHLAECAPGSPCHMAAIRAAESADREWIGAREAFDEFEDADIAAHRAAHVGTVRALLAAYREATCRACGGSGLEEIETAPLSEDDLEEAFGP